MNSTLLTVFAALIVAAVLVVSWQAVRLIRSMIGVADSVREAVGETKPLLERMLGDAADSAASVRRVVVRLNDLIGGFVSLPDFAKTFTKRAVEAFFKTRKRETYPKG